jgi:REP element-mobilizing transposase RayT
VPYRYGMNAPLEPQARAHKGWHERGYLPHFDGGAVVQTVTFRLADSLPRAVYDRVVVAAGSDEEQRKRLERLIDRGRGACILRQPEHAATVANALQHFDGERYRLLAWVIMPNHVHAMLEQADGHSLSDILHSWKSFTAKRINEVRQSNGAVWSPDYYDRFVRNGEHYVNAIRYIEENPVKAGLVGRAHDWPFSSARGRVL